MPCPDLSLLDKVLDHIRAHPLEWDQADWERPGGLEGTTRSFGGHALHISGHQLVASAGETELMSVDPHGHYTWADAAARHVLGLEWDDAWLFLATSTGLDTLSQAVDLLRAGGRPRDLRPDDADALWSGPSQLNGHDAEDDAGAQVGAEPADPLPDIVLLGRALDHIRAHPWQWHQETWIGTGLFGRAQCFGGRALTLAGYRLRVAAGCIIAVGPDGRTDDVAHQAAAVLGLTRDEACWMFSPDNTLEDLERLTADVARRGAEQLFAGPV